MIRTARNTSQSNARHARADFEPLEGRTLFAAGALDPSFGAGGILRTDAADFTGRVAAIAVQPDGKVVAVGSVSGRDAEFRTGVAVVRYNPDGSLDRSFGGGDGVATFDRFNERGQSAHLTDVEVLPNGDIIAAGSANDPTPDGRYRPYLLAVRLDSSGAADPSFGDFGMTAVDRVGGAILRQRTGMDQRVGMDALPSGEVLVAGTMAVGSTTRPAVVKFTAAGAVDTSFGRPETPGLWTLPVDNSEDDGAVARDVQARPDGRIIVVGDVKAWGQAFVARLTPGGVDDTSFGGGDGLIRLDYSGVTGPITRVSGNALALQADGKIVVAGHVAGTDMRGGFRITRLNPDGSIDTPFGDNGTQPFTFAGVGGMPTEVTVLPDGKIVAAGFATRFSRPGFVIGRLEPDGDMDYSFGDRGRVYTPQRVGDLNYLFSQYPVDMGLLSDGKILMAGNYPFPGDDQSDNDLTPVFARYLSDSVRPPPPPPPGDDVVLQAEDFAGTSGKVVRANNSPGYTGSGFVDFVADRDAVLRMDVDALPGAGGPGDYLLEFRYANGSSSARSMNLTVGPDSNWQDRALSFPSTGSWSTWKTLTVPITLRRVGTGADGAMTVTFVTTGRNGPNLDSMTVRPVTVSTTREFQAEQATLVGAKAKHDLPGYTGTGYADYTNATGDSVEWAFDDAGGSRTLTFRYANGSSSDRPLALSINGQVVSSRLSFARTGSWSQWREVSVTVSLVAGANRVRLTSVGSNGPNVDVLKVG